MATSYTDRKKIRRTFGKIPTVAPIPNLIEVQKSSYDQFLQLGVPADKLEDMGIHTVFKSVFPIKDYSGKGELEYVGYEFDAPKFDVDECLQRGLTFAAPLRAILRLVVWDIDEDTEARSVRDIKEQDVYMGDMPLMTPKGTFVVNGTERVIVSQMHRSPGVFFSHDKGKTHSSGKYLFAARVIPYRGSWLDFEFDAKDIAYVRIDRRRKLPLTTFLYALESEETRIERARCDDAGEEINPDDVRGMTSEEILSYFYNNVTFKKADGGWKTIFNPERMKGMKLPYDLVDAKTGDVKVKANVKITARLGKKLVKEGLEEMFMSYEDMIGRYSAVEIISEETGEIFVEAGEELTAEIIDEIESAGITEILALDIDYVTIGPYIRNTLFVDKNTCREEALIDIYRVMRPGEPPTLEAAEALFNSLFFDSERYDLSAVGRVKMNGRLDISFDDAPDTCRVLREDDILKIVKVLVELKDGKGDVDDIDNLGNRRVRSVGELIENQYRIGLLRMERAIRERMGSVDIDSVMPHDLINAKPVAASVREFFGSSQLSQFMDETNPLAEITHKRRLSALGPGGLTRERAGFEVRDVHPTHYGRICPIETPEGPNIGLINSLATYARVNQYGFIESPYRKVNEGYVTNDVVYLSAMEESRYIIAQANASLDAGGCFTDDLISCRKSGDFVMVHPNEIDLIDVSPKQLVSVAAALIPFLENDDANRALMGSNMQRQAVPLLRSEAPLVGTGMEATVARDSRAAITAKRNGIVQQVDGNRVVIHATDKTSATESGVDIYNFSKFQRSNQGTCLNQTPLVRVGDFVSKGDIIADGPSTEMGELALGRNVLVAFMPWNGYNYEDSILISERIVRDDVYTSIHLDEFEVMARDTKLGQEEITRDIPNVGEEALRNLDESGIIYIGADVKPGDILVGKVTPKGESPMTPEEKLLRAIFGEKSADVRDTSLRVPPGGEGTIVEVRVFNRRGVDKDERAMYIERAEIERLAKDRDAERSILEASFYVRLQELLISQEIVSGPEGFHENGNITEDALNSVAKGLWRQIVIKDDAVMSEVEALTKTFDESIDQLQERFDSKVDKVQSGDEMLPGVLKMVKVFIATKRKLQPGDKMAGRHGNKGVISKIAPIEDMPHMEDGTAVDIVLNPLGVPSRMNVGQILETHLGWACEALGRQVNDMLEEVKAGKSTTDDLRDKLKDIYGDKHYKEDIKPLEEDGVEWLAKSISKGVPIATPVFDGAHEADIVEMLDKAGLNSSGQVTLFDGRTGEKLDRQVTVGYIYMLKLHHLVDDKIHARSIGPYSLVTQQPLGGKAQFGGQRFGEMEVWALEAYGAAYTLQEMLTVKSDDVSGRTKVYESIVRGDDSFEAGIPESFNVLVKEMRSLCLDVELNSRVSDENVIDMESEGTGTDASAK
ncbi:MAG: DNA-directed RNA polymerase subunit beta [Desulfobulbaceae bacterium]|nr:DNA-directed RNA polymerase subunit beta [Desulfobulbaceae bacterium]